MENREIVFMGKIAAGMTHEIKNVFAIIRESAGLMEDLWSLPQNASSPLREKSVKTLATIQEQVNRGVDLSNRLNRFSHSMDVPVTDVDVGAQVEQVVALQERFARLKQVTLRVLPPEGSSALRTNPLRIQMVLCACMEQALEGLDKGGEIQLRAYGEGDRATIQFLVSTAGGEAAPVQELTRIAETLRDLQDILPGLEVKITVSDQPEAMGLLVYLKNS